MKLNEFKLERFFAQHEFSAPYLLCASDCESVSIRELFNLQNNAEQEFMNIWLGYTESLGNPLLRKEIAKLYSNVSPDELIVFSGAEEGIFVYMNALLKPGDQVIVQSPCYQSLTEIAHSLGCTVVEWKMDPKKNWALDIEWLERSITVDTKCIVLNFPNNPTGYLPSQDTFLSIIEIAKRNGIFIFSDEVYRWLEYEEKDKLSAMCDEYDCGVSLGVMSKSFGLPGLRIGWLVCKDRTLFNKIAAFKDYTTICNSAPSEFLAILALQNYEVLLKRNLNIIQTNLVYLNSFFKKFSNLFSCNIPKAGPLIFPCLNFTEDGDRFCKDVLKKKGVLLAPGSQFNYDSRYFRLGYGRKNMSEALTLLEQYAESCF